ncbi:hypothetical protein BLNAU_13773 [Blattamonas nauphoetae]|uniref:Uncharacterized protein n=1 Tax=Blattamonas nauphoetae TaxID=2049346 RepID=A0ABQ9XH03_9EUKA|nr:hypothetical protein BLNAU_13773 [Blattamonas nauphoetae]
MSHKIRQSDSLSENHDISCTGFSLSDTELTHPTGILCNFGCIDPQTALSSFLQQPSTTLLNTQLTNVTSPSSNPTIQKYLPKIDQTVIGCVVKHSTNHFSGTTIRDFNSGGSFLAINSSFAHCTDTLVPSDTHPNYILQNYTGTNRLFLESPSGTILVQRCSFEHMSNTQANGGAGICVHHFTGDVTVKECLFIDCTTTSSGGAVVLNCLSPYFPATVEDSTFIHCTAPTASVGALSSTNTNPLTVVGCVFDMCQAKMVAGAIGFSGRTEVSLSNDVFIECSSSKGACMIQYADYGITCSGLSFRRCSSTATPPSHDLLMQTIITSQLPDDLFATCSSTWTSGNVHWSGRSPANPIPMQLMTSSSRTLQLTTTTTETSIEFTLTVSSALSGSVEAFIHDGSHSRLVVFAFSGTSATCSASNAQGGEDPTGKTYLIRSACIAKTDILFPRLSSVSVTQSEDLQTILISLIGTDFLDSSVVVTLKGDSTTMDLTFHQSTANVLSLNSTILPSSSHGFQFGKSYTVLFGKAKGVLHFPDCGQTIDIPALQPIKQITTAEIEETHQTYMVVQVNGENIPKGDLTFTVSDSKGNQKEFDVWWSGNHCFLSVTLYPREEAHFAYSEECKIIAVNDSSILLPTGLTFTLPDPPPFATSVTCVLNDDLSKAIITVCGGPFDDFPYDLILFSDDFSDMLMSEQTPFINSTALAFEAPVFPDWTAASEAGVYPYLLMNQEYTVGTIYNLNDWSEVLVDTSLVFTVPPPPVVTGASFEFVTEQMITGIVTLTGQGLQRSGEYEVTVGSPPVTFSVHTEGTELKSNPLPIRWGTASLKYDTTFTLPSSISKKGNNAITIPSSGSFTVGASPFELAAIVVDRTGNDDISCGETETLCRTIARGWRVAMEISDTLPMDIVLKVKQEASFGTCFCVRKHHLRIKPESGTPKRVVVESTLKQTTSAMGTGILNVDDSSILIEQQYLHLLAKTSSWDGLQPDVVVQGKGLIVMESVWIVQDGSGKVGIGLVSLSAGLVELNNVHVDRLEISNGVSFISGDHSSIDVEMKMSGCVLSNLQSGTVPLISFSSSPSSSSSFQMTDCVCSKVTTLSNTPSTDVAVILVRTGQSELAVTGSQFIDCGIVSESGALTCPVFCLHYSSQLCSSPMISFSSCSFIRSSPSSPTFGALHITLHTSIARITLSDCLFNCRQLDSSKVMPGALIEYQHSFPIVVRRKTVFSNCNLSVVKR